MSKMYPGWSTMLEDDERAVLERALRMFAVTETMDLDPSPWHRRRSSAALRLGVRVSASSFLRVDEFEGRVVHASLEALLENDPSRSTGAAELNRRLPRG